MSTHTLEIPFAVDLTHEDAWLQNDEQRYVYFVARMHLVVEGSQQGKKTYPGEILAEFQTTPKSATKKTTIVEKEISVTDVDETLCAQLMSETFAVVVTSEIVAQAQLPFYTLAPKIGATIERAVQKSLNIEQKVSKAVTHTQLRRVEIENKIFPNTKEKIYAVESYRRIRQDVFLWYLDYLFVVYEASLFGLRKKKKNLPRPVNSRHVNRIPLNMPLFSILHWELLSESSSMMTESAYQKLEDLVSADEIEIRDLERRIQRPLPYRPERPTLYTLSNIAFPSRWIDRKGEWTREELMKIELNEAEGSFWWFQYGPGKKSKK
jgi:hypothetical protein